MLTTRHKLQGVRILNTRPLGQNTELSIKLRELGADVFEWPVLSIIPIPFLFTEDFNKIDFFIFTSQAAVNYFFSGGGTIKGQIIAIGSATAKILKSYGINDVIIPEISTSEGILALDCLKNARGKSIILVKGEKGRSLICESLTKQGAHIKELCVYRRIKTNWPLGSVQSLWQRDTIDIIIYTSEEAIHYIFEQLKGCRTWLCSKTAIVLSERLAKVLHNLGVHKIIVCDYNKIDAACLKGIIHE